jgi:beta-glucosidase
MEEPASGTLELTVAGEPGQGPAGGKATVDLTAQAGQWPTGEWHTVHIALRCFAFAGANLEAVHTPWQLSSDGSLTLRFAEVKLTTAPEGQVPCQQEN